MEKLLFVGDFFYDYDVVQEDIKEIGRWVQANKGALVLNFEGSLGLSHPVAKRGPNLHMHNSAIDVMKMLNVKVACLANNHMMDYGSEGLECTISALDRNQIIHVGAGNDLENALRPKIFTVDDKRFGILNFGWDIEETVYATEFTSGCAPKDKNLVMSSISEIRKKVDYLIVCLHWGFEYNRLPLPCDINLAHQIIDSGADLIIGHHPHCVQPLEIYKGKRIYYSLGNFYFGRDRDGYNKVFKHEQVKNQSDYGILVEFDCNSYNISEKMICYSKYTKMSCIVDCDNRVLENISDMEYKSWHYHWDAYRRRNNINPILTDKELVNRSKLEILFFYYKFKEIVKKMIWR